MKEVKALNRKLRRYKLNTVTAACTVVSTRHVTSLGFKLTTQATSSKSINSDIIHRLVQFF